MEVSKEKEGRGVADFKFFRQYEYKLKGEEFPRSVICVFGNSMKV